jgi:hypothetical protein
MGSPGLLSTRLAIRAPPDDVVSSYGRNHWVVSCGLWLRLEQPGGRRNGRFTLRGCWQGCGDQDTPGSGKVMHEKVAAMVAKCIMHIACVDAMFCWTCKRPA